MELNRNASGAGVESRDQKKRHRFAPALLVEMLSFGTPTRLCGHHTASGFAREEWQGFRCRTRMTLGARNHESLVTNYRLIGFPSMGSLGSTIVSPCSNILRFSPIFVLSQRAHDDRMRSVPCSLILYNVYLVMNYG